MPPSQENGHRNELPAGEAGIFPGRSDVLPSHAQIPEINLPDLARIAAQLKEANDKLEDLKTKIGQIRKCESELDYLQFLQTLKANISARINNLDQPISGNDAKEFLELFQTIQCRINHFSQPDD